MSRFLSDLFSTLEPYTPGEQPRDRKYIKLNTNESPYPPSEKVITATRGAERRKLNLYSDPEAKALVGAISEYYRVGYENVFVGNGSDEVLAFAFHAYRDRGFVFPDVTYGFYPVFSEFFGIPYSKIPLDEYLCVRAEDYCGRRENVVIANPNAQTGIFMPVSEIEKIVASDPDRVVIVDEAYIDFGGESVLPLISRYKNLLVVRTFSKSRNLAGARIGYALGDAEIIRDLNTLKFSFNPYNINRLSLLAGEAAIRDTDYFESCRSRVIGSREYLRRELLKRGFFVTDSLANFHLARHDGISGERLYSELKTRGILVRHLPDERIKDFVRITVGSSDEVEELLRRIDEILADVFQGKYN